MGTLKNHLNERVLFSTKKPMLQVKCKKIFIILLSNIVFISTYKNVLISEEASCAIVKFLEIESTEESSAGWMLLSTINLLSMGSQALIDCMTAASLPSTIVKCLYLFFDLPDLQNPDDLEMGCEFSPRERRVLLQKMFVQVGIV